MSETYPHADPIDWDREDELDDDFDWTDDEEIRAGWSGTTRDERLSHPRGPC